MLVLPLEHSKEFGKKLKKVPRLRAPSPLNTTNEPFLDKRTCEKQSYTRNTFLIPFPSYGSAHSRPAGANPELKLHQDSSKRVVRSSWPSSGPPSSVDIPPLRTTQSRWTYSLPRPSSFLDHPASMDPQPPYTNWPPWTTSIPRPGNLPGPTVVLGPASHTGSHVSWTKPTGYLIRS